MKITILGAGRVGGSVAENLVGETNDITVVDSDPERLKYLQDRFDLRTVCGNAAEPRILRQAGLEDAEMLLAVTPSDAVNMVACQLAKTMFNVPTKIARIRSSDFRHHDPDFLTQHFGVDFAISPEDILTQRLRQLLEYPEALQVLDFAGGKARMVAMRARQGGLLVGCPLCDLPKHLPAVDIRVAAIYRDNRAIFPDGDTVVAENDEVFFIAPAEQIRLVARELRNIDRSVRRVMIAGGGNVGYRLARTIENDFQVKLIEANPARAEWLAQKLQKTLVLRGEATDEDLLDDENVGEMDVFLALTNDDEDNIMSSLLAKKIGARKVIALINRGSYVDLLQGGKIDIAVSPSQMMIGSLLAHIRRGDMAAVHSLRHGAAEAFEAVAHGDAKTSRLVGRRLGQISFPAGASVGALVRGEQVLMAHHDLQVHSGDHLIVFVANRRLVPKVEKVFEVGFGFWG